LVKLLHQTHATAEELAAAPENTEAYNTLNANLYSNFLRFAHTEASAHFKRFGISRADHGGF
jgi:hypothetical protein